MCSLYIIFCCHIMKNYIPLLALKALFGTLYQSICDPYNELLIHSCKIEINHVFSNFDWNGEGDLTIQRAPQTKSGLLLLFMKTDWKFSFAIFHECYLYVCMVIRRIPALLYALPPKQNACCVRLTSISTIRIVKSHCWTLNLQCVSLKWQCE